MSHGAWDLVEGCTLGGTVLLLLLAIRCHYHRKHGLGSITLVVLAAAWGICIAWCNSSAGQFSLLRRNVGWAAEDAAEARDEGYLLSEVLQWHAIPADAHVKSATALYVRLCREAALYAFQHGDLTPRELRARWRQIVSRRAEEIMVELRPPQG